MTNHPTPAATDTLELAKNDNNLVWLDCEMSGLDPERERLLEIAIVVTGPDLSPRIEGPVIVIHQSDALLAGMDAWNKGTHGKSGLIDKVKASEVTEAQAEDVLIDFMKRYVSKGVAPMWQHDWAGPAFSGRLHAAFGGFLSLPQPRCQHFEGIVKALEARGLQQLQKTAKPYCVGRCA